MIAMNDSTIRERYKRRMDELGMRDVDILRRTNLNRSFMTSFWAGTEPKLGNAISLANAVGWSLTHFALGETASKLQIEIRGIVDTERDWSLVKSQTLKAPLDTSRTDLEWYAIRTRDLEPHYRDGDIVGGVRVAGAGLHNLAGQDCIIETAGGDRRVCTLLLGRKSGVYDLRTIARLSHAERDVRIAWAAAIQIIMRGGR